MNKTLFVGFMVCFLVASIPASGLNLDGWEFETIDNNFMVMLPPGWTHLTMDSGSGPATGLMNINNPDEIVVIMIIDNPLGSAKSDSIKELFIKNFNKGAGITLLNEPTYGEDSINEYGIGDDGSVRGVSARYIDDKISVVYGKYSSIDDALAGAERLGIISGSIILV